MISVLPNSVSNGVVVQLKVNLSKKNLKKNPKNWRVPYNKSLSNVIT